MRNFTLQKLEINTCNKTKRYYKKCHTPDTMHSQFISTAQFCLWTLHASSTAQVAPVQTAQPWIKHMIWCPPHCVTLHKIWVSSSTAPTQGRRFTPCSSSILLPAKQTQGVLWQEGVGGSWHSSGVSHGLQHMRVLASSIPFFPPQTCTTTVWAASRSVDTADTSATRGLRRGGLSNHFYSVRPVGWVCLPLRCVSPGRCRCWMWQLGTCCSINERGREGREREHSTAGCLVEKLIGELMQKWCEKWCSVLKTLQAPIILLSLTRMLF